MTNYISNAYHHYKTIQKHRHLVREHCIKCGIPLQGYLHDLSKFTPVEFMAGVKYFQGDHSPNVEERKAYGYSKAWLHHKSHNKHHFEYWFDNSTKVFEMVPVEMPLKYVKEMFCDRVAASKVYRADSYTDATSLNYLNMMDYTKLMHPETYKLLRSWLVMLAEEGEDATFAYIKSLK